MRYHNSQCDFRRYQPYKSRIDKLRTFFSRNKNKQRAYLPSAFARAPQKKASRAKLILATFFILTTIWAGLMIYLPYFKITKITFSGLRTIRQDRILPDVQAAILEKKKIWPADNYFILSPHEMADYLKTHYALHTVSVKKVFPDTVAITLEEKISSVIYDDGKFYYLLGEDGMVIKALRPVEEDEFKLLTNGSVTTTISSTIAHREHLPNHQRVAAEHGDYPIIYDLRAGNTTTEKMIVVGAELIKTANTFRVEMEKQEIGEVKYYTLDNLKAGLRAKTNLGFAVFIQPSDDLRVQVENLKILLRAEKPIEYVDLRYEGRVYWK